jgi:Zn-dependent protease
MAAYVSGQGMAHGVFSPTVPDRTRENQTRTGLAFAGLCATLPTFPSSMLPAPADPNAPPSGTWPLFTFRGVRVFLHWSWILVAVYHINKGKGHYTHIGWDIAEYVTLFAIVLMHEFGHVFATRQVGGRADQILLWPFGGIAYVQTPPRAGAYLWGIAAGPLVNAVLWPVLYGLSKLVWWRVAEGEWFTDNPALGGDLIIFTYSIFVINTALLIFNLLPIFPMDGGQILRGLLWFKMGQLKSTLIAAWVGLVLGGALAVFALVYWQQVWIALVLGLMVHQAWMTIQGVRRAQASGSLPR